MSFQIFPSSVMFSLIFKVSWNFGVTVGLVYAQVCRQASAGVLACLVGVSFSDLSQQPRLHGPGSAAGPSSFAASDVPLFESTGRAAHVQLVFFALTSSLRSISLLVIPFVVFLSRAFVFLF